MFSLGRLEMAQIYPSGDPQRPLKVLRPLLLKGLERSCRQLHVKNTPFPDLKLDTFPVPLEARIEPWLQREAHSQFLGNALFPDLKLDTFPVPQEARIEPWLEREAHSQF